MVFGTRRRRQERTRLLMDDDVPKDGFNGEINEGTRPSVCPFLRMAWLAGGAQRVRLSYTYCLGEECALFGDWPAVRGCFLESLTITSASAAVKEVSDGAFGTSKVRR